MRRVPWFVALVVAATAFVVIAAGCGSSSNNNSNGSATGSSSKSKKYTIGIVAFAGADPTSSLAIDGVKNVAKQKGWSVSYIDPNGEADKAVAAMQDLVQKKVDLMMVTVFPAKALAAGAIAAKAAGIPIVSLSGGLGNGIQTNYDSGIQQGQDIAARMVKDMGGKGDLLALGYKSGLPCIEREAGLDSALKGTSIKETRDEVPIPGQVEAGTRFTAAWLAKHPADGQPKAIWACFDDPALGAISAVQSAGRKDVKIYGINGQPAAIKAIERGQMTATVFLDAYKAGQLVAENAPRFVAGGTNAKPQNLPVPSIIVDKDTVKGFLKKYPNAINQ